MQGTGGVCAPRHNIDALPDLDAYLHLALAAGLTQRHDNFLLAYADARARQDAFRDRLAVLGATAGAPASSRPRGTKGLERLVEKYLSRGEVPLDLLMSKAIVPGVGKLCDVAT